MIINDVIATNIIIINKCNTMLPCSGLRGMKNGREATEALEGSI